MPRASRARKDAFLEALAALCEEYNAEFYYTVQQDGIHIEVDGEEVFVGDLVDAPAEALREWIEG